MNERKIKSTKLVKQFISDKLKNNIENLKTYDFSELRKDAKYGCQSSYFRSADTEIAIAIFCLVWGEDFPNVNLDTIGEGKSYIGAELNSFNTLFSKDLNVKLGRAKNKTYTELQVGSIKKGLEIYDHKLIKDIVAFQKSCNYIGNMILLPETGKINVPRTDWDNAEKKDVTSTKVESLVTFKRMTKPGFGDYFDTYLSELERCYNVKACDRHFQKLVLANKYYFGIFGKNQKGFLNYCDRNFLNDYLTEEGNAIKPLSGHGNYGWWNRQTREEYENYAKQYLAKASVVIDNRTDIIVRKLKKELNLK